MHTHVITLIRLQYLSVAELWPDADLVTGPLTMQFEEFERVAFVNQILEGMWAYLDATICSAIKEFVEPVIQENLPFPVSGFEFEKLAFGDAPFQIRGVKHASLFDGAALDQHTFVLLAIRSEADGFRLSLPLPTPRKQRQQTMLATAEMAADNSVHSLPTHSHPSKTTTVLHPVLNHIQQHRLPTGPGQPMSLSVEVDASWVTKPDIVAKLMPSKRWRMSPLDIRPAMYVRVDYLSVTGRLRLVFPLQQSLPIFNGMSICFLHHPEVRPPPSPPPQHTCTATPA